ncbi:hypothetical protein LTR08_005949 [Meristemomyces frigidus]|nr:hypothetical protein LTR08_005949 [Meristemomyces frigidus]
MQADMAREKAQAAALPTSFTPVARDFATQSSATLGFDGFGTLHDRPAEGKSAAPTFTLLPLTTPAALAPTGMRAFVTVDNEKNNVQASASKDNKAAGLLGKQIATVNTITNPTVTKLTAAQLPPHLRPSAAGENALKAKLAETSTLAQAGGEQGKAVSAFPPAKTEAKTVVTAPVVASQSKLVIPAPYPKPTQYMEATALATPSFGPMPFVSMFTPHQAEIVNPISPNTSDIFKSNPATPTQGTKIDPIIIDGGKETTTANRTEISSVQTGLTELKDRVKVLEEHGGKFNLLVEELTKRYDQSEKFRNYLGTPASRVTFKIDVTYPNKSVISIPVKGITLISELIRDAFTAAQMTPSQGNDATIEVDGEAVGHCRMLVELDITGPTTKKVVFGYN